MYNENKENMIQIAHRGLSEYFKDNSKQAFYGNTKWI